MLKISRKNIWKETGLFLMVTGGDGERERSDTKDRSDCSSSEDMDL